MTSENEFVVSLNRVKIPEGIQAGKVMVSLFFEKQQFFIQKERTLKGARANLFRESFFLPYIHQGLDFRIYSVEECGNRTLLHKLEVPSSEMSSINKKIIMFKTQDAGFELVWDSWIFSEQSEDLGSCTDRDYSELDFPFQSEESFDNEEQQTSPNGEKQLSSTDGSHSPKCYEDFIEQEGNFPKAFEQKIRKNSQSHQKASACLDGPDKRRVRTMAYTKLVKGISGLFGHKKESSNKQ